MVEMNRFVHVDVRAQVKSLSEVGSGQLRNPVLAQDFKLSPNWLHFYHASPVDSCEDKLCPVTKQRLILKIFDIYTTKYESYCSYIY